MSRVDRCWGQDYLVFRGEFGRGVWFSQVQSFDVEYADLHLVPVLSISAFAMYLAASTSLIVDNITLMI